MPQKIILTTAAVMVGLAATAFVSAQSAGDEDPVALLRVPDAEYRRDWALLGSFSVLDEAPGAGAKEFHVVYTPPENVDAYRSSDTFPDGTILVKDVFAAGTEDLTTGRSSYASALLGRFVMVKDQSDGRAIDSPLWGDGWGWAFYEGAETQQTVTTDFRQDCLSCHEPVREQDLIHTQGYPVLKE